jgi:hypothetical protein
MRYLAVRLAGALRVLCSECGYLGTASYSGPPGDFRENISFGFKKGTRKYTQYPQTHDCC